MSGDRHARSGAALLEARDLAAGRGTALLFEHVGLAVAAGEALVVTGANGSGKTTLLRIAAGLSAAWGGTMAWRGRVVAPFDATLRSELAYLGHAPGLKDELTARENLIALARLHGERPTPARVDEALARVGIGARQALAARALSQGQRRRIGLARLALMNRRLWILDEPATALDRQGVGILEELLRAHLEGGGCALIATHQPLAPGASALRALDLG